MIAIYGMLTTEKNKNKAIWMDTSSRKNKLSMVLKDCATIIYRRWKTKIYILRANQNPLGNYCHRTFIINEGIKVTSIAI